MSHSPIESFGSSMSLGFQTPNVRRYLDTKNIPKTPNLRRYDWKIRVLLGFAGFPQVMKKVAGLSFAEDARKIQLGMAPGVCACEV